MKNDNQNIGKKIAGGFLVVILLVCFLVPIPYYVEVPGSAEDLKEFVTVDGKIDRNPGSFMLTTVGIRKATIFSAAIAKISASQELVSKADLMGGNTDKEYTQVQKYYMDSSQNAAMQVALDLAEIPYEMKFKGVYIMSIEPSSNFLNKLEIGDVIYEVDGQAFENLDGFMNYVKGKKVGAEVKIAYKREGTSGTTSGKLIELSSDKKPGIGIGLVDHTELKTDRDIQINAGSIGGPSAGLMFTLQTYSLLSEQDLRQGREIAGTGTIASDGTVGPIGGIDKKIIAADKEGAEIFFAPQYEITKEMKKEYPDLQTNYEEAVAAGKRIKTKMKIVPVTTVQDAIDYLKK